MTASRPPRLATWLLKTFGCSDNNDAVIGDLAERCTHGKKGTWYWRQVLIAIVVSEFNYVRGHKLLALRGLALGWGTFWVLVGAGEFYVAGAMADWGPASIYPTISYWSTRWTYAEFAEFYEYALSVAIGLILCLVSGVITGWIVAKTHHRFLLPLFNATVLVLWISLRLYSKPWNIPGPHYWGFFWMAMILQIVGVFTGGLLKRDPKLQTGAA